jgi:hypothetical protein
MRYGDFSLIRDTDDKVIVSNVFWKVSRSKCQSQCLGGAELGSEVCNVGH